MEERTNVEEVTSTPDRDAHRLRDGLMWTAGLGLLLVAIGLAVPDLREVLGRVAGANPIWLGAAVALEVASCLGYVAVVRLVLPHGPARPIRWLAWSEMAFGAVVPVGGAGGLAVGAWAMRAWGVTWSRIANRSAVIFLLTSAVNAVVLALSGLAVLVGIGSHRTGVLYGVVPTVVGVGSIGIFLALPRVRSSRLRKLTGRVGDWVTDTEAIAFAPNPRLLGAVGYLLFDIGVLWVCFRAVGTTPPVLALVLGYQVGYLGNLIPVPGGLGVLDGGLVGALLLYGLPVAPTAAAVVLYHSIALWIPALGGTVGFARLRRSVAGRGAQLSAVPTEPAAPAVHELAA